MGTASSASRRLSVPRRLRSRPESRRYGAVIGMPSPPRPFPKRAFHQHLLGASAGDQMVDECREAGIAAERRARGQQTKRCRRRRQQTPSPVSFQRQAAVEIAQDDEARTFRPARVGPRPDMPYLGPQHRTGLLPLQVPIPLRAPAAGPEMHRQEAQFPSLRRDRDVRPPSAGTRRHYPEPSGPRCGDTQGPCGWRTLSPDGRDAPRPGPNRHGFDPSAVAPTSRHARRKPGTRGAPRPRFPPPGRRRHPRPSPRSSARAQRSRRRSARRSPRRRNRPDAPDSRSRHAVHRDVVARTQVVLVIGCSTSDLDT